MGTHLIIAVTLLYFATAISFFKDGRPGLALTYLCYALANVGLLMESVRK